MKLIDIIIIIVAALIVAGVVAYGIYRKRTGESGCGCGCRNCNDFPSCPSRKKENKDENV